MVDFSRTVMRLLLSGVLRPIRRLSEISRRVPSVYLDVSFGGGAEGYPEGVHSPRCLFNEEALPVGAACYAWCALRWLQDRGGQE